MAEQIFDFELEIEKEESALALLGALIQYIID